MSTPRRGRRSISENVWLLQTSLAKILNDNDRTLLIHSLNQYQKDRDVLELVASLKRVLDSPKKREVYPLLRDIIPSNDKRYFERAWHTNQHHVPPSGSWTNSTSTRSRGRSQSRPQERLRRSNLYSSLPENLDRCDSGVDLPALKKSSSSRSIQKYPIRRLYLKRAPGTGYGFCMRGGSEHGVGLYVSSVDENSIAEYEGLLPGDHILSVNEIQFDGLSHDQAVKVIKNNKKLNMVVRSVGRIPNTFVAESTYKWIDPTGQRVSPPPNVDSNGREMSIDGIHRSDLRLLGDDDERKVNVFIEEGDKLGLRIRGGSEYGLGIYIAGVDPNSAAQKAGLKCGDQIMDVNGISFLNITHADAVKVLKSAKNMMVTMKDVGRLPFAKTVTDRTRWTKGKLPGKPVQSDADSVLTTTVQVHEPPHYRRHTTAGRSRFETEKSENSKFSHGIAGSQLLYNGSGPSTKSLAEDQARQILNENELGTMSYYMDEYSKGFITIDAFVLALFSLFNTPTKVSLLSEVRGFIHPKDIDRFDDLVLKKEIAAIKKRKVPSPDDHDAHSIRSYSSSASNYSEYGSSSSRSSAKESLESRPITPPRVPEMLPENIKVPRDSIPSPPTDFTTIFPLSSSSPRKAKHDVAVTNGEITKYFVTGDNTRAKDAPHEQQESKTSHKRSEKQDKATKKSTEKTPLEKKHSKNKLNDSQSSSDLSFELIPDAKKEKLGFFLHHNKGSYSPSKHDHSSSSKGPLGLYHVKVIKNKDGNEAGSSMERPVGEKLGDHFGKAYSSLPSETPSMVSGEEAKNLRDSENDEEKNESTLLVDEDDYALPSTVMNGHCISSKKVDATKQSSNELERQPSNPKAPVKPKPQHATTDDSPMEGNISNANFEGKQSFKSGSQPSANSAFTPPKPKPYISSALNHPVKNSFADENEKKTSGDLSKSNHYASRDICQPSKESSDFDQQDPGDLKAQYVDTDSIKRAKQLSRQKKAALGNSIDGDRKKHEYVDPKVMDLAVNNPPPIPKPCSSKAENNVAVRSDPNASYPGHDEGSVTKSYSSSSSLVTSPISAVSSDDPPPVPKPYSSKVEMNKASRKDPNGSHIGHHETGNSNSLVTSPVSENTPEMPKPYSPKSRNIVSEKNNSKVDAETREINQETWPRGASPIEPSHDITPTENVVDKNNNPQESSRSSKENKVVSPNPEVYDLKSGDQVYDGMYLAMEETATTRSGVEKSTGWGEDSQPLGYSYTDTEPSIETERLDYLKSAQDKNLVMNLNQATTVFSDHDEDNVTLRNDESVTTKGGIGSHASPKQDEMSRQVVKGTYIDSKQKIAKRTEINTYPEQDSVTTPEGVTKDYTNRDNSPKYDVNQNLEDMPKKQSVQNMILAYNKMSGKSDAEPRNSLLRRNSATNRKSWDGVGNPSKTEQCREVPMVEKKKSLKSNSDSNLMNLPKDQQKSIQVKLRASQELLELRQQSRDSSTNNSRRSSIELSLPAEPPSSTASSPVKPMQSQHAEGYGVEIEKTSNGLGLSLEGGSDTSSINAPVKIKLIKEGPYAAHTCRKLRPGQILLQINNTPIQGMTNAMAILMLRQAYSDPETKTLMLVVKDP